MKHIVGVGATLSDDKALLIGSFKHGFGRYKEIREDPELPFLARTSDPSKDDDDDDDDKNNNNNDDDAADKDAEDGGAKKKAKTTAASNDKEASTASTADVKAEATGGDDDAKPDASAFDAAMADDLPVHTHIFSVGCFTQPLTTHPLKNYADFSNSENFGSSCSTIDACHRVDSLETREKSIEKYA
jgi:hypothetical protein